MVVLGFHYDSFYIFLLGFQRNLFVHPNLTCYSGENIVFYFDSSIKRVRNLGRLISSLIFIMNDFYDISRMNDFQTYIFERITFLNYTIIVEQ